MSLPPNLAHHIRVYLTGSEVDLQTVSAKQIRIKLATIYPDLDIKALRSEIDGISIPIFHEIKENFEAAARAAEQKASAKAVVAVNPSQGSKPSSSLPKLAVPSCGIPTSTNGTSVDKKPNPPAPTSTTSTTTSKPQKAASSKTKKRKSAAYVDTDDEDGSDDGASAKKSKPKKPRAPRKPREPRPEGEGTGSNKGIHVELNCSTALAELIGVPMCSRPQVVKKIWDHIKSKGLQDPSDKRQIICDEPMKKKVLVDHLYKNDEAVQKPPEEGTT